MLVKTEACREDSSLWVLHCGRYKSPHGQDTVCVPLTTTFENRSLFFLKKIHVQSQTNLIDPSFFQPWRAVVAPDSWGADEREACRAAGGPMAMGRTAWGRWVCFERFFSVVGSGADVICPFCSSPCSSHVCALIMWAFGTLDTLSCA